MSRYLTCSGSSVSRPCRMHAEASIQAAGQDTGYAGENGYWLSSFTADGRLPLS